MALTTVNTGDTFYPGVLNQLVNVLQRQGGQSDAGKYMLAGNAYTTTGLYLSCYITSRSRNATPVGASIDTADQAPNSLNSPLVGHLTSGGVQIYASPTAANGNCYTGGNVTFNY